MKKSIVLFFFITGLNAGETTLEKVTNMLSIFTLVPSIKEQLAKQIATDIKARESSEGSKFPFFIDKEGGEEDYYYRATYYKKENGEIDFKGDIHSNPKGRATCQSKIALKEAVRPLNFDFSSLSDAEIKASFIKEWKDIYIDSAAKKILFPLLINDLIRKIRESEHSWYKIPGFIKGGDGTYEITYHIDKNSIATIDTFFFNSSPDETRNINLTKINKPINFDWKSLSEDDIKAAVRPLLEKKIPVIGKSVIDDLEPDIVEDLYDRVQAAEEDARADKTQAYVNIPYFLGGDTGFTTDYHIDKSGKAIVDGFSACRPADDGDRETITLIENSGLSKFEFLNKRVLTH